MTLMKTVMTTTQTMTIVTGISISKIAAMAAVLMLVLVLNIVVVVVVVDNLLEATCCFFAKDSRERDIAFDCSFLIHIVRVVNIQKNKNNENN